MKLLGASVRPGGRHGPKLEVKMYRHTLMEMRRIVKELGMDLASVPGEMTDAQQPLDQYAFGAMKASSRQI
jgi:hypothetical protein